MELPVFELLLPVAGDPDDEEGAALEGVPEVVALALPFTFPLPFFLRATRMEESEESELEERDAGVEEPESLPLPSSLEDSPDSASESAFEADLLLAL